MGDKYNIISDGKRKMLIIKDCTLDDKGPYVALVGSTKATAELTVIGMYRCPGFFFQC